MEISRFAALLTSDGVLDLNDSLFFRLVAVLCLRGPLRSLRLMRGSLSSSPSLSFRSASLAFSSFCFLSFCSASSDIFFDVLNPKISSSFSSSLLSLSMVLESFQPAYGRRYFSVIHLAALCCFPYHRSSSRPFRFPSRQEPSLYRACLPSTSPLTSSLSQATSRSPSSSPTTSLLRLAIESALPAKLPCRCDGCEQLHFFLVACPGPAGRRGRQLGLNSLARCRCGASLGPDTGV
eukprot:756089-Hanusia_phi.AAC.4